MEIRATDTAKLAWTGDALAFGIFEGKTAITGELAQLDEKLAGTIAELIEETEFEGKLGSSAATRVGGKSPIRKLILVGLGQTDDLKTDTVSVAAAAIARQAKNQNVKTLGISLPVVKDAATTAEIITTAIMLTLHQDNRFKSEVEEKGAKLESVELLELGAQEIAISKGEKVASGVILARELVAAPANSVTPITMAQTALEIAKEYGLSLEILEQEDCEKLGMGAFLGVAKASDLPPKFIHITYKPEGTPRRKLAIVGKGLTFDTGGYNLKVAGGIETMKMDMGGGAATLGAAKAIGQLKPDVEVHFISAVTENMISGRGMHPGDILTASNGKTIEVNNTDAEGRLTLADALVFAEKLEVEAIVDLATLTGACVVALGDNISGLWSTDEKLAQEIKTAAEIAGEKFWEMPLEEKYFDGIKSDIADMKNTGPRQGGAITAAVFLKQFVEKTPWVHLDIAGPVWAEKESGVNNKGATGFPVRTLVNWVLS
ncbi:MAG: leucyl aminopeptidase [Gomphosphaeria aponina SAG 52.96 = DSM 107014]|uniref:Probable cytosol aminopeptidase n=1 Tax=Gomphosphaeria aponina SAG 52.96 = DSM 107014 TaxID=1521640 RepID=A0A941GWL5_9CHRO|nr:leucyl aminopeptidase [Gomphosphaeria aponina SAG 52.96 = DSM 107014]